MPNLPRSPRTIARYCTLAAEFSIGLSFDSLQISSMLCDAMAYKGAISASVSIEDGVRGG
jgi:cytochrome c oxidase assembly protein Cox11